MNNIYPILISSIAGLSTMLGNLLLFIPIKYKNKIMAFSSGLSFIVLILISVGELILEGLKIGLFYMNSIILFIISLFILIIGYKLVLFVDYKINKVEELLRVGILSMIVILIHNIPEGIICAISSNIDYKFGLGISLSIMIHNIPEGICIALPIYYATKNRFKALLYTFISGGGEIVGALITMLFLKNFITPFILYIIFILTAGIMISLSLNKLLVQGLQFKENKYFIIGIIIGILIIIITL